ncbi:MAG: lactate utilization protein [Proteobacteria bacterium]|nr:lactate utilization protein [Pseudomonadota bacterium]
MGDQRDDPTRSLYEWSQIKKVDRTRKALERNGFKSQFVPDARSAVKAIMEMIPDRATVGVGGSMTLNQIGFFEAAKGRRMNLLNPFAQAITPEEGAELRRKIFSCDYFLSSTNAITEGGQLYNLDSSGNRVGAMFFGPQKAIVVCGINKIVKDMEEARTRVWNLAAPMNAKRLARKTPCAETGVCSDCNSPERICNISVEIVKKPPRSDIFILIVGEPLGF